MSMKRLTLKGFRKTIAFYIPSRFVYNPTNVFGFETTGNIKVFNVDVFGSFTT